MYYKEIFFEGKFLTRKKRFLIEFQINKKRDIAHCPNTGSMETCLEQGAKVLLSYSKNSNRKIPFTLEMIESNQSWIFLNTLKINKIIKFYFLQHSFLKEMFCDYQFIKSEPMINNHKLDFLLFNDIHTEQLTKENIIYRNPIIFNSNFNIQEQRPTFIEVKNVTYYNKTLNCLQFPDAKTKRGLIHLNLLQSLLKRNFKCYIMFVLSREEGECFKPAYHIDPAFSNKLYEFYIKGGYIIPLQLIFEVIPINESNYIQKIQHQIPLEDLKPYHVKIMISGIKNIHFD